MSKALTLWYPEINPDIPNVPIPALEESVRAAAIRFCEKTHLWAVDLDRIDVVADQSEYTLTVDADLYAELVEVQNVKFKIDAADDDQFVTVDPVSEVQADINRSGGWRSYTATSPYQYYIDPVTKTTLNLLPVPEEDSTEGLLVKVVIKPLRSATVLPDFLYNDYREIIGFGAKSSLFRRKGMPWYDPRESVANERDFLNGCNNGKWRKVKGAAATGAPGQVKMRPMA